MTAKFNILVAELNKFINNRLSADEVVQKLDAFVSDDDVYDLPIELSSMVLDLQDKAAFYVYDVTKRAEYEGYIGEDTLIKIVDSFFESPANSANGGRIGG